MEAEREIVVQTAVPGDSVPSGARIRGWVGRVLNGAPPGEVTVRVVDEAESARLNERYRKGRGPTDVLAFGYGDPARLGSGRPSGDPECSEAERPFGDLVICAAVVERDAAACGRDLEAHWAHIAVHGALHLLGYDHEEDGQARVMEARERELLASLGFDDPYGEPP